MAEAARTRDRPRLRWGGAAFVVAVCAAGLLFGTGRHAHAALGTPVCGTLPQGVTTWNAAGSPYLMCDLGVFVNQGSTLNLDATLGAVTVQATGRGPLQVASGTVRTVNTSPVAHVSFDGPSATRGAWYGILLGSAHYNTDTTSAALSYVDIAHAQGGIQVSGAKSVALDHIAVSESRGGIFADSPLTLTSSTVHGVDQEGIHVECFGLPVSVTDNAVDAAGWTGWSSGTKPGCRATRLRSHATRSPTAALPASDIRG